MYILIFSAAGFFCGGSRSFHIDLRIYTFMYLYIPDKVRLF